MFQVRSNISELCKNRNRTISIHTNYLFYYLQQFQQNLEYHLSAVSHENEYNFYRNQFYQIRFSFSLHQNCIISCIDYYFSSKLIGDQLKGHNTFYVTLICCQSYLEQFCLSQLPSI
ncbi:hypothetical protein TTHERM_000041538 (macronuclear) [Tetrahymena thermophila SB210]|uniref:Uncharacterized protein n=1 Tax=Tetrahymena thermophila (strain SB210) TaxID=312017 RepID=W7XEB3_TETTS|nr:hypothetical protein TTHERM_000041538 [Tetrahymena thermophila SB210]EWS74913.1 hypothetical protein TTHERM_000041538 [Tetrahymena thermophila SB210]|eukprot:XP_012652626.1 hypothetical protein TTHERM_000041538 [Tetrahymena thermophila SB210]